MVLGRNMSLLELQDLLEQDDRAHSFERRLAGGDLEWLSDVTLVASRLARMPMAFVSVLDSTTTRFVAVHGGRLAPQERGASLCDLVASGGKPVVITDAATEPTLAHYPAVRQGLRSYVGLPIVIDPASRLSFALCVADSTPHTGAGEVVEVLQSLTRVAQRALIPSLRPQTECCRRS